MGCDSWGRKTGFWVESSGASMGVQADTDYWYSYINQNGHHWLRQPTSFLPPGKCDHCYSYQPPANQWTDTQGVTTESLESDGSVVRIHFPEVKTMLKIGNLDAFYGKYGGCDASGPVSYRVFTREAQIPKQTTLDDYGGGWVFVNEAGRSKTDTDDLSVLQPKEYDLPEYEITSDFNEVLVQRTSATWCDSWGRKTGFWVEPSGASMGVQADKDYWYSYINENGHHWLRQPA